MVDPHPSSLNSAKQVVMMSHGRGAHLNINFIPSTYKVSKYELVLVVLCIHDHDGFGCFLHLNFDIELQGAVS